MSTSALPQSATPAHTQGSYENYLAPEPNWVRWAVSGGLLTGGILLLSGKRRTGMIVSVAATALTLLEQQDTVKSWWNSLPGYLDDAQRLLDQAQQTIDDLSQKRDKLRGMFNR